MASTFASGRLCGPKLRTSFQMRRIRTMDLQLKNRYILITGAILAMDGAVTPMVV